MTSLLCQQSDLLIILLSCLVSNPKLAFPIKLKLAFPHRHNAIQALTVTQLQQMEKLTVLLLTGNPLQSVWEGDSLPANTHFPELQTLELSMTNTSHLQASSFTPFSGLTTLRLSCDAGLHVLGSLQTKGLHLLDMQSCNVKTFSPEAMKNLSQLRVLHADNYKMCCPQVLPEGKNDNRVRIYFAPVNILKVKPGSSFTINI